MATTQFSLPIENLDPSQISSFLHNLPIFLPSLQRLLTELGQNSELSPSIKSIHDEIINSLDKLKTHATQQQSDKSPDYAPILNKPVFSRTKHKQGLLQYKISTDESQDWVSHFVRVRENILEIFLEEPDKTQTELSEKPIKSITLASSFTFILEGSQACLSKPNSFAIRLQAGKDIHDECFVCSSPQECRHWLEALQIAQTQSETVQMTPDVSTTYEGPRELPNPLLHYEVPRQNIRRESFGRVSRASSYEKMSDDSSLPPDFNSSQDRKLYGRFRNLFTKLNKKEREISPIPFSIDLQKLVPSDAVITGVLNVKFYMSNEHQAYWAILISTKLFLYENYEKISFGIPNHSLNMLDFKFQKGPPSESKFKLLHNQNSVDNIQFEFTANQTWSKSILAIADAFDVREDFEDDSELPPVYDVPTKDPRITSIVVTQDNEIAIYDVPSKKPRVVETRGNTLSQQEGDDTYDVPSNNPRPVESEGTPPEQRPEDMYDVPSKRLRPVNPLDIAPAEEPDGDTYDVPSNRPVIPPRPNFSYGSVYSDLESPPHSPGSDNITKAPSATKFELPPVLPMARRPIQHVVQSSNPEITKIESVNSVSVEGFLKLLTDGNIWIKFFFILRDRFLQAFDDVTKLTSPVLVLDVFGSEYSFIPSDESKRKFSFSLGSSSLSFNPILKTSRFSFQNVFVFSTDSFRDFKTWRNAIFEIQGVFNISKKSTSVDQLSSFDEIPNPIKPKPIRRVFSSVRKREQAYGELDQRFAEQNQVYVTKPKSKSVSLPVTSRNSEKIYSRVFETNQGKQPGNTVLNGFLSIFSGIEWKKHWFELRNKFLTCFEYQDSIRTIFEIDLSKSEITEASKETNRDFSFKLANKPGDIVYFFCADSEQIYTEWITALILISVKKELITSPIFPGIVSSESHGPSSVLNGNLASECVLKSPPQLKGNLLKRTSNGKWEQRYCIVKDGVMLIYRSNQATPLQRVVLTDSLVNVSNSLDVSQNHAFEIRVFNSTDLHFFAAFSQSKLEEWLLGLRNASTPKSPLGLTSSNSSQEKFDISLDSSLNKLTPDFSKNTRPPKPTRTESIRGGNPQLDNKLPALHLQNPTKVGMLNYRSVSSKIWGRRHCIIHDLCLYIYLHPSSEHPQKVFALPGCEIKSSLHETSKYLSFSIEHRTMKAYLSTQSLPDMQTWIEILTKIANSTLHGNESSFELTQNSSEVPHFKLQTSTPNQNGKHDNHFEQIQSLIYQSNKDVFDTYFHSNRASKNLLNSIESIQKKRSNLQAHLIKLKQAKQKEPEKVQKIRELLLKYEEAIQEFRSTLESNKTETSSTIAFLEFQLDNSLSGLRSLTLSNSELSVTNGIRGISNTLESETLI